MKDGGKICMLLILVTLSSCSASWHVKKAMRLDPSLFESKTVIMHDTVTKEIPKFLDRVQIDTLVEIVQTDPITNTEYIVKYKIQNDTILIECPDQEIITVTETTTETITIKPTFWERIQWSLYIVCALALGVGVKRVFF